jgi:hypothetical protein
MWIKYVGGYNDQNDGLYKGVEYRILGELDLYFIVEDMNEVTIEKYKFEIY